MSWIGTGYRLLGAGFVILTAGLTAMSFAAGRFGAAIAFLAIGAALAWIFWAVGGAINGGVAA